MKIAIAGILVDEGYIEKYDIINDGKMDNIHVTMKYHGVRKEKTITGLKSKKTYYVKVRAVYVDPDTGLVYNGTWSGWRSVKTK